MCAGQGDIRMHLALLFAGVIGVLVGAVMAYAGYANFDFSYGGTLVIAAATVLLGGLLLIGVAACLSQLRRIARILQAAFGEGQPSSRTGMERAANEADEPERRVPVLPPRPPRAVAEERAAKPSAVAQAPPVRLELEEAGSQLERSAPEIPPLEALREWPRVSSADRVGAGDDARGATAKASQPPPVEDVACEDITAPERSAQAAILKSGVIEGMAYTLYADGSVEAEMPQGIMRFASVAEWREYLRPQQ